MNLYDLLARYSRCNGIVTINDDNLNVIVKGKWWEIMQKDKKLTGVKNYERLFEMEVVAFSFCEEELCVRVK